MKLKLTHFRQKWEDDEKITVDTEEEAIVATKIIEEVSGLVFTSSRPRVFIAGPCGSEH